MVLITLSSTAAGGLASSHRAAQYLSVTLGLDPMPRFVEVPEANRVVESDARAAGPRAPHHGR